MKATGWHRRLSLTTSRYSTAQGAVAGPVGDHWRCATTPGEVAAQVAELQQAVEAEAECHCGSSSCWCSAMDHVRGRGDHPSLRPLFPIR